MLTPWHKLSATAAVAFVVRLDHTVHLWSICHCSYCGDIGDQVEPFSCHCFYCVMESGMLAVAGGCVVLPHAHLRSEVGGFFSLPSMSLSPMPGCQMKCDHTALLQDAPAVITESLLCNRQQHSFSFQGHVGAVVQCCLFM
jgi:hypothetical protein